MKRFDFNEFRLQLAAARQQQGLNLDFSHIIFDPAKHPRLAGKFTFSSGTGSVPGHNFYARPTAENHPNNSLVHEFHVRQEFGATGAKSTYKITATVPGKSGAHVLGKGLDHEKLAARLDQLSTPEGLPKPLRPKGSGGTSSLPRGTSEAHSHGHDVIGYLDDRVAGGGSEPYGPDEATEYGETPEEKAAGVGVDTGAFHEDLAMQHPIHSVEYGKTPGGVTVQFKDKSKLHYDPNGQHTIEAASDQPIEKHGAFTIHQGGANSPFVVKHRDYGVVDQAKSLEEARHRVMERREASWPR